MHIKMHSATMFNNYRVAPSLKLKHSSASSQLSSNLTSLLWHQNDKILDPKSNPLVNIFTVTSCHLHSIFVPLNLSIDKVREKAS